VLLDALEDLRDHRDAIVVVGAQAVYLQTGPAAVGVAEYTTDADLAVDADRLADLPLLEDLMLRRFSHRRAPSGAAEPGIWTRIVEVSGEPVEIPVDLIVPQGLAPRGGTRGARLGPHGKQAARKAIGLEAALFDNDLLMIDAFEPSDGRRFESKVAGPTALLIAKAHKIQDRLEQTGRPDRLNDKDAADVYRLMLATPLERVREVTPLLLAEPRIAQPVRWGLDLLLQQFGARRAPGVEMAVRALRLGVTEDRVRSVCVAFTSGLQP
jgi:hypothetical protein